MDMGGLATLQFGTQSRFDVKKPFAIPANHGGPTRDSDLAASAALA